MKISEMKNKWNTWKNSLSVKLISIICIVIIPMVLLLILISQQMIDNLEREIITSYKDELSIYITGVDAGIDDIKREMTELMGENWVDLSPDNKSADITRYTIWKELKNMREELEYVDVAFLKTKWDNKISISHEFSKYTYKQMNTISDFLFKTDMKAYEPYVFEPVNISEFNFIIYSINLYDYSFGAMIDISTILTEARELKNYKDEIMLLVNNDGETLSSKEATKIDIEKDLQDIKIDGDIQRCLVIRHPFGIAGYNLVRIIPEKSISSAIPFLERIMFILGLLSILLIPILIYSIRKIVLKPLSVLNSAMHEIESENIGYQISSDAKSSEFIYMDKVFNRMSKQIQSLKIESYEKDIEKLKIETDNLRLQINPHLLLNSLNMIYSLAQSNNVEFIKKYTLHLVDYFRYSLRQSGDLVTVKKEMEFVESFLEVQKIRFPNSFVSVYDIDEELNNIMIPPFIVQNFVENSIKYAFIEEEIIEIIIIMKSDGENIIISICDTGRGMEQKIVKKLNAGEILYDEKGKHIGIWNCRRRLKIYYGDSVQMKITSRINGGTQVWMKFPLTKKVEDLDESFNSRR